MDQHSFETVTVSQLDKIFPSRGCHRHDTCLPLACILSQMNPFHIIPPYFFFTANLMPNSKLRLGVANGFFPPGFPTKILHLFLFSPSHASPACAAHLG